MRRTSLRILKHLQKQPASVTELAEALDKNQGWISELVTDLEDQNLVTRNNQKIEYADTYEARLLKQLAADYDIEQVLTGKKEDILTALLDQPLTPTELQQEEDLAQSTVYTSLQELRSLGILKETDDGYRISSDDLRRFLEARTTSGDTEYTADGDTIIKNPETEQGEPTAFSAFTRYGVDYHPADSYYYRGGHGLELEDILIHAVRFAETRKQTGIAAVFYLTHSHSLDRSDLWRLARKWNCVEKWADVQAFLDQRDVKQRDLFLPWDEFTELARDYDVYPRGKHPEQSLLKGLEELGDTLEDDVDAYLLGGGNLILRGLKDSTKDLDIVVSDDRTFTRLVDGLQSLGYEERGDLEEAYEQLNPSIVLEKQGFPRWDIFVTVVADSLHLTDDMKQRADQTREYGRLHLHLLSLTDIFLFKSITDREGDLEDNALIARQGQLDWRQILDEIEQQEELTDVYFSFAVLDTLDLLKTRYDIEAPIQDRLASYCLENALLVTLNQPKTIDDLREELDFPDHQIYNKLRKLEEQGDIQVDRTGKLNIYTNISSNP